MNESLSKPLRLLADLWTKFGIWQLSSSSILSKGVEAPKGKLSAMSQKLSFTTSRVTICPLRSHWRIRRPKACQHTRPLLDIGICTRTWSCFGKTKEAERFSQDHKSAKKFESSKVQRKGRFEIVTKFLVKCCFYWDQLYSLDSKKFTLATEIWGCSLVN